MIGIKSFITKVTSNKKARQVTILYASLIGSLVLGILVSVINTRFLGPDSFGDYKFLQTIWNVGVILITFGIFTTGGNLLAEKNDKDMSSLMGTLLVASLFFASLFVVFILAISPLIRFYFSDIVGDFVNKYFWVVLVLPIQLYLRDALRGTNDIRNLALLNLLPHLFYIIMAMLYQEFGVFDLSSAIVIYFSSILAASLVIIIRVKPQFINVKNELKHVLSENNEIGLHIYYAIIFTTVSAQIPQFSLAYFYSTRQVGEFALALTLTMPLTLIPNAISTTFFKDFVTNDSIPTRVIIAATSLSLVSLSVFLLIVRDVVGLLYSESFSNVVFLAYLCAIGASLHGVGDVYNRFLLAKRKTVWLKRNAQLLSGISIFGYVIVVMVLGVKGAVYTKLLIDLLYLISMILFYKKVIVHAE